jgi:hypothetical protein
MGTARAGDKFYVGRPEQIAIHLLTDCTYHLTQVILEQQPEGNYHFSGDHGKTPQQKFLLFPCGSILETPIEAMAFLTGGAEDAGKSVIPAGEINDLMKLPRPEREREAKKRCGIKF